MERKDFRFCPKCGKNIQNSYSFCPTCGDKLDLSYSVEQKVTVNTEDVEISKQGNYLPVQELSSGIVILVSISLVLSMFSLLNDFFILGTIGGDFREDPFSSSTATHFIVDNVVEFIESFFFIIIGVLFLFWKFRCYSNLQYINANKMQRKPYEAVVYYFIPFVNLIVPIIIMNEIWKSTITKQSNDRSINEEMNSRYTFYLGAWWILFIIYFLIEKVSILGSLHVEEYYFSEFVSDMIYIPFCILFIKIIRQITILQETSAHS